MKVALTVNFFVASVPWRDGISKLYTIITLSILDPRREVISIYNDNFTTPASRVPYIIAFIVVLRRTIIAQQTSKFIPCNRTKQKLK